MKTKDQIFFWGSHEIDPFMAMVLDGLTVDEQEELMSWSPGEFDQAKNRIERLQK